MKKKPTGKVRKQKRTPKPFIAPPFDPNHRHSIKAAQHYLGGISRPTIDKKIKAGSLEVVWDCGRKFITGRSLAAQMLPKPPVERSRVSELQSAPSAA